MNEAVERVFAGVADAALTIEQQAEIAERQGGRCFDCAEPLTARRIHGHFVPRSRGGLHNLANRIAVCVPCEQARGDRLPTGAEMTKQFKLLSKTR